MNVVPGDEAAVRVADAIVQTEVLWQEAQRAKKEASEAMLRGDVAGATIHLSTAMESQARAPGWTVLTRGPSACVPRSQRPSRPRP